MGWSKSSLTSLIKSSTIGGILVPEVQGAMVRIGGQLHQFFPCDCIQRWKRNRIERPKTDNGQWVEEDAVIKDMVLDRFLKLFSFTENIFGPFPIINLCDHLFADSIGSSVKRRVQVR